jgi:hypothetical protein
MSTRTTYGYWHNRAVDGKQVCNHYARQIGGECGHPDLGVWTPLVKQDKQVERDAIWLAHLASGSSWPGEMANAVQVAADRVAWEYGSDAKRIAIKVMRGAER